MFTSVNAGEYISFSGSVPVGDKPVVAAEFSFDDGHTWLCRTAPATHPANSLDWFFTMNADKPGRYRLLMRAIDCAGNTYCSGAPIEFAVIATTGSDAVPVADSAAIDYGGTAPVANSAVIDYGGAAPVAALLPDDEFPRVMAAFGIRPVGGFSSRLFRSRRLSEMGPSEAAVLNNLRIGTIYDLRKRLEVERFPTSRFLPAQTVTFSEDLQNAPHRTSAEWETWHIGEYGAPGERMERIYRTMAAHGEYFALVIRRIAAEGRSAPPDAIGDARGHAPLRTSGAVRDGVLLHCTNGKDRTGVLVAQLLRVAGADMDTVMADYLATNECNRKINEADLAVLVHGIDEEEQAVVRSLFEAREEYLMAFFSEIDNLYGGFEAYQRDILRIDHRTCAQLASMMGI